MKLKSLMTYVGDYKKYGQIQERAVLNGDHKSANKAGEKMQNIFKLAKESDEKERFYLSILESAEDATTLTSCCAEMMELNIQPILARKKLEEIMDNDNKDYHPILAFNAKMFLQEWDKGNIKPII